MRSNERQDEKETAYVVADLDIGDGGAVRFAYPVGSLSELPIRERHAYADNFAKLRRAIETDGDLAPEVCLGFLALRGARITLTTNDESHDSIHLQGLGAGQTRVAWSDQEDL